MPMFSLSISTLVIQLISCYGLWGNGGENAWNSLNEVDFTLLRVGHFPVIRQGVQILALLGLHRLRVIRLVLLLFRLTVHGRRVRLGGRLPWGTCTFVLMVTGFCKEKSPRSVAPATQTVKEFGTSWVRVEVPPKLVGNRSKQTQ